MNTSRRITGTVFTLTLEVLLIGGVLFVAGQNGWLEFFNNVIKPPLCIAASACAVAGFLLSYGQPRKEAGEKQEATSR